jgi:hypothetical protein
MRRLLFLGAALAALILFCERGSSGAASSGALRLLALTEDSAPVEGATIVVIDPQMSVFRREARTDAAGRAEILDLSPRDYYLRVEKESFQSHESSFTARSGEMTQRRVVLDHFGPEEPAPEPDPTQPSARPR